MQTRTKALTWGVGVLFVGLSAMSIAGQAPPPPQPAQPRQPAAPRQQARPRRVETRRPANPQQQDAAHTFRAKDVLGMTVKNGQGEAVGAIEDLVIDGRTGQVQYALVSYTSFENQDQLTVMPWTILQAQYGPTEAERFIVADVEPQRVQRAPMVTRTQWPQVVYSEWGEWHPQVDQYYQTEIERKRGRHKDKIEIERRGPRGKEEIEIERKRRGGREEVEIERED